MIIYYAVSTYHVECCVLHRLTREPDDRAVLLLSDIHVNSMLFLERYRASGMFDEIIPLRELDIRKYSLYLEQKKQNPMAVVNKCCARMKKAIPVDLKAARTLYVCLDTLPFGWYLVKNKIPHVLFEDGSGILSDSALFMSTLVPDSVRQRSTALMGLLGDNPSAVAILADTQTQKPGYANPKMKDFSVKRILAGLNEDTRQPVLDFFGCPEQLASDAQGKISLLLTQHMANLGIMSLEEQHRLYLLLADYFLQGQTIVVKPHPDDIAGRYKEIFGEGVTVLPFAMPSELLPYCIAQRFDTVLAASSTAAKSFADLAARTLWFEPRIHADFIFIHRYYVAARLLAQLFPAGCEVYTNGNHQLLSALGPVQAKYTENFAGVQADCFVVSDDADVFERLPKAAAIVFLNERGRHLYFDGDNQDVFAFVRPIIIEKNPEPEEVIYVYSENPEILREAEAFQAEIPLPYCGLTVQASGIGAEERMKIKVLEGMLEATEERLRDYIAMKKEWDASNAAQAPKPKRKKA